MTQNILPSQFSIQLGIVVLMVYGGTSAFFTLVFVGPYRAHAHRTFIKPLIGMFIFLWPLTSRVSTRQVGLTVVTEQVSGQRTSI
jgi:hypothetical protein